LKRNNLEEENRALATTLYIENFVVTESQKTLTALQEMGFRRLFEIRFRNRIQNSDFSLQEIVEFWCVEKSSKKSVPTWRLRAMIDLLAILS
jgi:hypothetical protein